MGYQECLVMVRPQWRVESAIADYLAARQQNPDALFHAEVRATLIALAPIPELHCASGTTLLWITGERSGNLLADAMPNAWKLPLGSLAQAYPIECIQEKLDPTFLAGVRQGNVTYNRWFKYTPLAQYAIERCAKDGVRPPRTCKQKTHRKELGR